MTDEFSLIETYFAPLSKQVGDDCAILDLPAGQRLATSVDTLVENVHFPADAAADRVAFRALVTALSDLAAIGARPLAVSLALTMPRAEDSWLEKFSSGVEAFLQEYGVELIGGDTTRGPLTITVQVFGALPAGQGLSRAGAKPGDALYLSGCTGDAVAALRVMEGVWPGDLQYEAYLLRRFYQPSARLQLGQQLLPIATSAIDVSDGLLADAGHLCQRSGVGISIDAQAVPLSAALQSVPDRELARGWALSGGDDYELLFTVPAELCNQVPDNCTRIGEVTTGSSVSCTQSVANPGYRHFADHFAGRAKSEAAGESFMAAQNPVAQGSDRLQPARPGADVDSVATRPRPFASWIQFLAFGLGSGSSPKAPGTLGTMLAIPLYLLFSDLPLPAYTALLLVSTVFGIWLCDRASRELGVHDHPGIVWDEFVGYWITMWALPDSWIWVLSGFLLFRLFDILKPWPISLCDRRVHGGLGIMLDDILAGLISCALLHGFIALTASGIAGQA